MISKVRVPSMRPLLQPIRQSSTPLALRLRWSTASVCLHSLRPPISTPFQSASSCRPQQLPASHSRQHLKERDNPFEKNTVQFNDFSLHHITTSLLLTRFLYDETVCYHPLYKFIITFYLQLFRFIFSFSFKIVVSDFPPSVRLFFFFCDVTWFDWPAESFTDDDDYDDISCPPITFITCLFFFIYL